MLVLSRKVGERIHISDNIVVEVRRIAGNRVSVAMDAPQDVRILRGELPEAQVLTDRTQSVPPAEQANSEVT